MCAVVVEDEDADSSLDVVAQRASTGIVATEVVHEADDQFGGGAQGWGGAG